MEVEKEEYLKGLELTSGFSKPSVTSRRGFATPERWMDSVRELSNIGPYWRIHDKLYDLTDFIDKHPGGKFWLDSTKGMDITEAFVSSHLSDIPENTLEQFYVRDISTPRFSPFTFEHNGFYMTLKRKAKVAMKGIRNGPTTQMKLIHDSLFVTFLSTLFYACRTSSLSALIVAGIFLTLSANCAHNFSHQKDNWRMYIIDFTVITSSEQWRITHNISHHLFANTVHDFEIFSHHPWMALYPIPGKSFIQRYGFMPINPYFYLPFLVGYFINIFQLLFGSKKFAYPMLIQPLLFIAMVLTAKSFTMAFIFWMVLHIVYNFLFIIIAIHSGHHTNYSYIEGDVAIKDKDWGLHQVIATVGRKAASNNLPFDSVTFGNHTLHHLFPTIDQSRLHLLLKPFLETCEEFSVDFKSYPCWKVSWGVLYRFLRNKPNSVPTKLMFAKAKK